MNEKTHYRKVFKSDHLGVADLEEMIEEKKSLVLTIKEVKQEFNVMVAGRKGNHNIAYFNEKVKPLVLNSTNSKVVKSFNVSSPFVEDWKNTIIEVYIDDTVMLKGERVGGVRIRPTQPKAKVKPQFTDANFANAKKAKATIEAIKNVYQITPEVEKKYLDYAKE